MIAISYRREDSLPIAGRLYDRLQAEFGKGNVFMDFDSIPYGVDFREQIREMIERSKFVVAIIGPAWLGERGETTRRIDDPTDFVRLEIAYALERGIPIIPVLINNTPMPKAEKLPREIEGLAFRNALTLDTGIDFHHHADRLITGIRRAVSFPPRLGDQQDSTVKSSALDIREPTTPAVSAQQTLADSASRQRRIVIWSAAVLLAVIAASATWFLTVHSRQHAVNKSNELRDTAVRIGVAPPDQLGVRANPAAPRFGQTWSFSPAPVAASRSSQTAVATPPKEQIQASQSGTENAENDRIFSGRWRGTCNMTTNDHGKVTNGDVPLEFFVNSAQTIVEDKEGGQQPIIGRKGRTFTTRNSTGSTDLISNYTVSQDGKSAAIKGSLLSKRGSHAGATGTFRGTVHRVK